MCKATGGKVNPMIGAAGVSAVPMAARVVQKVGHGCLSQKASVSTWVSYSTRFRL